VRPSSSRRLLDFGPLSIALVLWYSPCPMPGILDALVAFVREHQRCGELDGDRDGGYVWLVCSCGAQIVQPATAPPREPAQR